MRSALLALLLLLRLPARSGEALGVFVNAGYTLFVIWYLLIVGHILRSALDTGLVTGFAIAVTWTIVTIAVSRSVFGASCMTGRAGSSFPIRCANGLKCRSASPSSPRPTSCWSRPFRVAGATISSAIRSKGVSRTRRSACC